MGIPPCRPMAIRKVGLARYHFVERLVTWRTRGDHAEPINHVWAVAIGWPVGSARITSVATVVLSHCNSSSEACGHAVASRAAATLAGVAMMTSSSNRSDATRAGDFDYPFVTNLTDSRGTGIRVNGESFRQRVGQRH